MFLYNYYESVYKKIESFLTILNDISYPLVLSLVIGILTCLSFKLIVSRPE